MRRATCCFRFGMINRRSSCCAAKAVNNHAGDTLRMLVVICIFEHEGHSAKVHRKLVVARNIRASSSNNAVSAD